MTARAFHRPPMSRLATTVLGGVLAGYILGATGVAGDILRAFLQSPSEEAPGGTAAPSHRAGLPSAEPTSAPRPSAAKESEPLLCAPSDLVRWTDHEPNFQSSLTITIDACRVLMVSSGSMDVPGGRHCGPRVEVVCAEVMFASVAGEFQATGLGVSWFGTAQTTIEAAIADKVADPTKGWFSSANCRDGCDEAQVFILDQSGHLIEERVILRP